MDKRSYGEWQVEWEIENEHDLSRAIALLNKLWDSPMDSSESKLLDTLAEKIHVYERTHFYPF